MTRISVVLPCLNEAGAIRGTVEATAKWMRAQHLTGEIIVADDGSTDGTPAVLDALARGESMLRRVRHETTRGYGAAVRSGCDAATMDAIVFMDSDGQFDPSDIGLLLDALDGTDVAWGVRSRRADGPVRSMAQRVYQTLVRMALGLSSPDLNCGLKAFRRTSWAWLRPVTADGALFHAELLRRAHAGNLSVTNVAVRHFPRRTGTPTGISPAVIRKMFRELSALRKLTA